MEVTYFVGEVGKLKAGLKSREFSYSMNLQISRDPIYSSTILLLQLITLCQVHTMTLSDSPAGDMYTSKPNTTILEQCLVLTHKHTMVRYPRNLVARTLSRHLTVFMAWWLYKIPGAYSMPTDLLAKTLARLLTLYIQLQYHRVIGSSTLLKATRMSTQL